MVDDVELRAIEEIVRRVMDRLVQEEQPSDPNRKGVRIGVSVRHLHLCQKDVEILFGEGYKLEPRNELYQKGEYATTSAVTLVGPRMRCMDQVRVLGPTRDRTQVEVSRTDAIFLGIDPPVRPSGNHEETNGIIVVGPVGVIHLKQGVIRANRHMHIHTSDAQRWGLKDNDTVRVRIANAHKNTVLEGVQVRVRDTFRAEMHVDTDDANACSVSTGDFAEILD
ncbi:MAG TPA: phosphate propanoyltransferase [bacterium]|nr:phosphate propanoyltransferase [bacterium]HQO33574.1 phosphate propanoyltransferase [bacterium]HQP99891.1 phosphate propanoyltransferase [bacterium]